VSAVERSDQSATTPDQALGRRYLLGELSEPERAAVDERLFADNDFFADILVVEGELMEDYLDGRLPDRERRLFESHFLASETRRRNLDASRALRLAARAVTPPAADSSTAAPSLTAPFSGRAAARRFALAAGLAAAALVVLVLGSGRGRPPVPLVDTTAPRAEPGPPPARDEAGVRSPATPRAAASPPTEGAARAVTLALLPGLVRGGPGAPEIALARGTPALRLELDASAAEKRRYQAVLRTADGKTVWRQRGLLPRRSRGALQIVALVPAPLLERADYVLTLQAPGSDGAPEDMAEYFFRVTAATGPER
jgi:anti-sigma factor RsiW